MYFAEPSLIIFTKGNFEHNSFFSAVTIVYKCMLLMLAMRKTTQHIS